VGVKVHSYLPFDLELEQQKLKQELMEYKRKFTARHDELRQKDDEDSHRIADHLAETINRMNALLRRL